MSAETLREAARLMRSRSRFGAASEVADWLEREAESFEKYGRHIVGGMSYWEFQPSVPIETPWGWSASTSPASMRLVGYEEHIPQPNRSALAVARAYLGEAVAS